MKNYMILFLSMTTSALLPQSTGSICTNLNAYAKDAIVKQKMDCKGTGTGGGLNAVGDQVQFANLPAAESYGAVSMDKTVSIPFPQIGDIVVKEFQPTKGNFNGKTIQVLLASYSVLENPPAGTPQPLVKKLNMAVRQPKIYNEKSVLTVFRRLKPVTGKMMYRTREPLWTEGSTVTFDIADPSMLGNQEFVIHPDGEVYLPGRDVTFNFAKPGV
jgi:hypothetical protein